MTADPTKSPEGAGPDTMNVSTRHEIDRPARRADLNVSIRGTSSSRSPLPIASPNSSRREAQFTVRANFRAEEMRKCMKWLDARNQRIVPLSERASTEDAAPRPLERREERASLEARSSHANSGPPLRTALCVGCAVAAEDVCEGFALARSRVSARCTGLFPGGAG